MGLAKCCGPRCGTSLFRHPTESVALALRAHELFNDWIVVGWDVAVLKSGICLIERNQGPDIDLIQRPLRSLIGDERFGKLMAINMERVLASVRSGIHASTDVGRRRC